MFSRNVKYCPFYLGFKTFFCGMEIAGVTVRSLRQHGPFYLWQKTLAKRQNGHDIKRAYMFSVARARNFRKLGTYPFLGVFCF